MHNARGMREGEPIRFYVAVDGDDRASGRCAEKSVGDGPFRTLTRARRAVRAVLKQGEPPAPIEVVIGDGTYRLTAPLRFGSADGGTVECPVTWRAETGARVVISGGRCITGFRPVRVNGRPAWAADLPEKGRRFRQLFVNGVRAPRTRLPAKGFYRIKALPDYRPGTPWMKARQRRFIFFRGDIRRWRNLRDVDVIALQKWIENRLPVARVDTRRRIVVFDRYSRWAPVDDRGGHGTLYWVENVFEALRVSGQWYLDRPRGVLYYLPRRSERMETSEVIAPVLPHVIEVVGSPRRPVAHLRFEGLFFAHTEWPMPEGWPASNQAANEVPGAVRLERATGCSFMGCAVEHVGGYGIEVGEGCVDTEIAQCRVADLGAGGVKIWHGSARTTLCDCEVACGGRLFPSGVGVLIGHSPGNKIVHNHIHDFFYTGISVGWVWGYGASRAVGNVIEWNHIHDIGQGLLSDMGGIYTLGVSPGTRLRFNHIHDVNCRLYGGWGIYTDEGSTDILIEKNLAYRCNSSPFHQHYGRENVLVNNIFAFGRDNQIERSRLEGHDSFLFERNIVYFDQGNLLGRRWERPAARFARNLYWDASGRAVTFAGKTLAEWQAMGMDRGSLIADPRFADAAHGDFRLRTGSPARRIGFERFDVSQAGPRPHARPPEEGCP